MSDYLLKTLEEHCVGTAESEGAFLEDAFVTSQVYQDSLCSPLGAAVVLVGRKGSGKTALLKFLDARFRESGIRSLYLKPDDLPLLDGIGDVQEISTLKRRAYQALVTAVATRAGEGLRGLLGRKDKKLFDKAVLEGARDPDGVQVVLQALSKFGSVSAGFGTVPPSINFEKLIPSTEAAPVIALRDSLRENFRKVGSGFVLLLDDIDQVAAVSQPNHTNRIWGFLLAAKKLTEELVNMKTVISVRREVWNMLVRDEHGQRDQVDHFRSLVRTLDPSDAEIRKIVRRRLEIVQNDVGAKGDIDQVFFQTPTVYLPTTDTERRSWEQFITKSARGRPRDAVQFLGALASESRKAEYSRISESIVDRAMNRYSSERVDDLALEFATDCAVTREVVNSFRGCDFVMSTEQLREHLTVMPTRFGITLRGAVLHPDQATDIFVLWRFVHELGLINPKVPDTRVPSTFHHRTYDDDPNFVSEANWNEMQKVAWEIHPAYRCHLIKLREDDKARRGISLSSFFRKN